MSLHVIIQIDDDVDDLEIIKDLFEQFEDVQLFQFTHAEDGFQELCNLVDMGILPCIVLLDMHLNGENGKEVLMKIRNMPKISDVPVAMFTGVISPSDKEFAEQHKASVIIKAPDFNNLKDYVQGIVLACHHK